MKESALIESLNLKSAIEYNLKNINNARDALKDIPIKSESEWDRVSLMNNTLYNFDNDPTDGFKKLNYLIDNPPFP